MITDPQAIRFINEVIRPLCEQTRALKINIDAAVLVWNGGMSAAIADDDKTPVDDKRESEGVSRLNGNDVNAVMDILTNISSAITPEKIVKPCVRFLNVR